MRYKLPVIIFAALLGICFSSCNSEGYEEVVIKDLSASNVEVKSFKVAARFNGEDADSLDFSVDLNAGSIFNADSLPMDYVLGNGIVSMTLPTVSKAEIVMHYVDAEKEDVVVDYLEKPTDSIDFKADKVSVRIVAANQTVRREYTVKVNVHKLKPDSLSWNERALSKVPGYESGTSAVRVANMGKKYYILSGSAAGATLASGDNLATVKSWEAEAVTLPSDAVISSFSATDDALFIITSGNSLYTSADGKTWSDTGESMSYIYGGYGKTLLGVKNADGKYYHVTYPASADKEIADGCPVSGTSDLIMYSSMWSDKPMAIFVGGKDAEGNLSGCTWGYDGSVWANLTVASLPAVEGVAVCQYYTVSTTRFTTSTTPVLYAFGGKSKDGTIYNKVYVSVDRGVHWAEGNVNIQLPYYVPEVAGSQAIVCDQTMYVDGGDSSSRAIKPVTSWECPYLYLIGGNFAGGRFNGDIYRGVINYLSFIPIQ